MLVFKEAVKFILHLMALRSCKKDTDNVKYSSKNSSFVCIIRVFDLLGANLQAVFPFMH
ncbi:hypothetical protein PCASD_15449 [Puccinia coronata f. sp. avenae]|uniref:Uncharacterized protein n=1 Tax=Puccinia coronata f. sp. avenae TaxID=200324 RepID=A0A2N5UPI8_9BASI|nr:hypothetical protein PCASD_15449 [Puccinia coronata f. sp. avenae]